MDINSLQKLMRSQTHKHRDRGAGCPDEQDIAAYFDGGIQGERLALLQEHLTGCEVCNAQFALLSRMQREGAIMSTPELTLAKARRMGRRRVSSIRRYSGWAAAVVVVLALGFTLSMKDELEPMVESSTRGESLPRTTRLRASTASAPSIVFPRAGQKLDLGNHEFKWTAIPGTLFYDIHIVNAVGDLVITERVNGTSWRFPDEPAVLPDTKYYVRIDAFLADAKTVSSKHVAFTIYEPR